MNKYGDTREPLPKARLMIDAIRISDTGALLVTDWQGIVRSFNDHAKGIAFATSLYNRKPKGIQAAKHGPAARWKRAPSPIVWHTERHAFTSGRAVKSR